MNLFFLFEKVSVEKVQLKLEVIQNNQVPMGFLNYTCAVLKARKLIFRKILFMTCRLIDWIDGIFSQLHFKQFSELFWMFKLYTWLPQIFFKMF